ncbi:MAG: UDP-N-acetylmuramoyl-L-alanine--D-glutamate ligase [Deltaproteobacteria bacterium]|nr:UDP-N-acetylmuramoyl-L-alanine--D-glutamate ligase [Deltaproteobacteria bacterium]
MDFSLRQGARVRVSDTRPRTELQPLLFRNGTPAPVLAVEAGGHSAEFFLESELILLSPGVPLDLPPLEKARARGIPIWGELELFSRFCSTPVVAVSGTNGKTTTTALLNEMLRAGGRSTFLGGNIGRPLTEYLLGDQTADLVVAEISSFQLDTAKSFRPRVGLLLNISPDHLDRYADFQAYIASKKSLFLNQQEGDAAVLNLDDPLVGPLGRELNGPVYYFSRTSRPERGAFMDGKRIRLAVNGEGETYSLERFALPGLHNRENALAAALGARLAGASSPGIQRGLDGFQGFGHRLEFVAEINGVRFYDDSKGTNVGAVVKALEGCTAPVILIAGGRDKGGDYGPLQPLVRSKVKALALIGEARDKMQEQLGALTRTRQADTLEEAVSWAFRQSRPGDSVLLSPACSSFDMFQDYGHRGRIFQQAVEKLAQDLSPTGKGPNHASLD